MTLEKAPSYAPFDQIQQQALKALNWDLHGQNAIAYFASSGQKSQLHRLLHPHLVRLAYFRPAYCPQHCEFFRSGQQSAQHVFGFGTNTGYHP
jgi:hypothetical protein